MIENYEYEINNNYDDTFALQKQEDRFIYLLYLFIPHKVSVVDYH